MPLLFKLWATIFILAICLQCLNSQPRIIATNIEPAPIATKSVYDQADPTLKPLSAEPELATREMVDKELIDPTIIINKLCFKKGMTFALGPRDSTFGIQKFVCNGMPLNDNGVTACGQFYGDTWCYKKRKILCINKLKLNRPAYKVAPNSPINEGWTGAIVQATPLVVGCSFATKAEVDAYCTKLFGCGYVLADFHDGKYMANMNGYVNANFSWNWASTFKGFNNFWTYIQGPFITNERFWVSHTDVYGANPSCWL